MVLGAGDDPILGILSSADTAMGRPWNLHPHRQRALFGVPSSCSPANAVTGGRRGQFRLRSDETRAPPTARRSSAPRLGGAEKPFPPQSLSFRAVDERVFAVDTDDELAVQ
jgi:hypothetical protein